jgi:hypothetical protein
MSLDHRAMPTMLKHAQAANSKRHPSSSLLRRAPSLEENLEIIQPLNKSPTKTPSICIINSSPKLQQQKLQEKYENPGLSLQISNQESKTDNARLCPSPTSSLFSSSLPCSTTNYFSTHENISKSSFMTNTVLGGTK